MTPQTIIAIVLGFITPCAIFVAACMQVSIERKEQGGW